MRGCNSVRVTCVTENAGMDWKNPSRLDRGRGETCLLIATE